MEYLYGVYAWDAGETSVRVAVPVNLRPFFNSVTTKNFFAMVSAEFEAKKETYTFEEVLKIVCESLRSQINKEHLEDIFSYNVSNEKILIARAVPLVLKKLAIRSVYTSAGTGKYFYHYQYRKYFRAGGI